MPQTMVFGDSESITEPTRHQRFAEPVVMAGVKWYKTTMMVLKVKCHENSTNAKVHHKNAYSYQVTSFLASSFRRLNAVR